MKPLKDRERWSSYQLQMASKKKKIKKIFADGFVHPCLWSKYEWFSTIIFRLLMKDSLAIQGTKPYHNLQIMCSKKKNKKKTDSRSNLDRWSDWSVNQTVFNMLYTIHRTRKTHIALQIKLHTRDRERSALQISAHKRQSHADLQSSYQCNCS